MTRLAWVVLLSVTVIGFCACSPIHQATPSHTLARSVDASACVETVKRDAGIILGPSAVTGRSSHLRNGDPTTLAQIDFTVRSRAGISYFTYYFGPNGICRLGHLDARWQNHSVPLTFNLVGGNLRRITWVTLGGGASLTVVDRWGRTKTMTFPSYPDGLTLWGDGAPLHAAVGWTWKTEAGPDVVVGKTGPLLVNYREGESFPAEWDVASQRFAKSTGVYNR